MRKHPQLDASVLRCRIAYNEYGGYCVPLSSRHRPAAAAIVSAKVWEPETIEFITSRCSSADIIHAGTFFGDFLPALSRACAPEAKVWAFEPNQENFRCAEITVLINDLGNVQLTLAALGDTAGVGALRSVGDNGRSLGGASHLIHDGTQLRSGRTSPVNVVTIDDVISPTRHVSVIQLDVEGYEKHALAGGLETIGRCRPILILETLPDPAWLDANLRPLGYRPGPEVCGNKVLMV